LEEIRQQIAGSSFPRVGTVTVSIGVAQLEAGDELTSWLDRADEALYEAKRSGRNTVVSRIGVGSGYVSGISHMSDRSCVVADLMIRPLSAGTGASR